LILLFVGFICGFSFWAYFEEFLVEDKWFCFFLKTKNKKIVASILK